MIELNNLTKYFGKKCAVRNINLTIERGDLFGLLGPNGAGKTTMLCMIIGLIKPSSGFITIDGRNLKTSKTSIMPSVGVLFENPSFYSYLSGRENLSLLAKIKGCYNTKKIDELLTTVSLSHRADEIVKRYSLGMKQRLALACALIGNPEILILDEPTNGLDPEGIHETLSLLSKSTRENKKTIIVSSHQVYDIESFCNRIAILSEGSVLCSGKLEDLLREEVESCIITTDKIDECKNFLLTAPWVKDFKMIPNKKSLKELYIEIIKKH